MGVGECADVEPVLDRYSGAATGDGAMRLGRRGFLLGAALLPLAARAEGLAMRPLPRPVPGSAAIIGRAGLAGVVEYAVLDSASGEILDSSGQQGALPPASTLKSLTAIYALDRLGAQHRFRTRVIRAGDMLVLAGGGDPHLDTDGLDALAADLVAAGGRSPARFAVWGGALPRSGQIAIGQAAHLPYNPALSGMILNFNRVHLGWRRNGARYDMQVQARAARQSPRAYTIRAEAADQQPVFSYLGEGPPERWRVSRAALGGQGSRWLPVRLPELYAGDVFQTLCRARGLVLPAPEVIDDLPAGNEVAGLDSAPLVGIVRDMLRFSTNITAEAIGLAASGAGSLETSGAAMAEWLRGQGVVGDLRFADHSGLSDASRISPLTMARALTGPGLRLGLADLLRDRPFADDLGREGDLPAPIRAKTGTLNFISNLAGYADVPQRGRVVFSIACADPARRAGAAGREQVPGVATWTRAAKRLQHDLIAGWMARL
ncbi:MAG: D-alanyl-D-alanine carboxypeptidase [Paracoccus sp. (in: a-proteobacteria)]|uniref:D-alanyl-D-alanine carboxypeptidase n=1 Tax=Paracoccus sp. TaxID=267 RepID=UPI0026DF4C75|nr:D-alanyl-D-alanine carboxypeptidase [Paracoccus sp. (in: a-proteobacteria)]MDO5631062.1 D-alanyl-D-alanine carboxypeptidase [Paracoccus sp. (in: a-proteobacteria)]